MSPSPSYYVDGPGFTITKQWEPDGELRWCWMTKGRASLMLQEFWQGGNHTGWPDGQLGQGLSLAFQREDAVAIYKDLTARGIPASEPFVGNAMGNFTLSDPDGYCVEFESPTDVPEETKLSEADG